MGVLLSLRGLRSRPWQSITLIGDEIASLPLAMTKSGFTYNLDGHPLLRNQ